jgi:hypothetical protein
MLKELTFAKYLNYQDFILKYFIKKNIEVAIKDFKNRVKIELVPNITNICYGRSVGYKIEEIVLSEELQKISATEIRKKMKEF